MKEIILMAVGFLMGSFMLGAEAGWDLLGKKSVPFREARGDLLVGAKKVLASKLMIKVEDNDLEIEKMLVIFGNGAKEEIPVRHIFKENSRSRIIDLPGAARVIERITFFYKTTGKLREGRAEIQVWAKK